MNYETDIRFVDPHAKGNGGDDYLHVLIHEKVLALCTQFAVKPCMVCDGLDTIGYEHVAQLLCRFAVQRIDDTTLALMPDNKFYDAPDRLIFFDLGLDLIIQ